MLIKERKHVIIKIRQKLSEVTGHKPGQPEFRAIKRTLSPKTDKLKTAGSFMGANLAVDCPSLATAGFLKKEARTHSVGPWSCTPYSHIMWLSSFCFS